MEKLWKKKGNLISQEEPSYNTSGRYPKRKIPKVCYAEKKMCSGDDFMRCEDCGHEYEGDCPVHGPMFLGPSAKVPLDRNVDRVVPRMCPPFLIVCRSGIETDGLGIWTQISLPKGVVFGPYQGRAVKKREQAEMSGCAWKVSKTGRVHHYVEGANLSTSNWLRFVNCAQQEEHQNLVAFQYRSEIYYRTYKAVRPYTELLVWYGYRYVVEHGIDISEEEQRGNGINQYHLKFPSRGGPPQPCRDHSRLEENRGSKFSALNSGSLVPENHRAARRTCQLTDDQPRCKNIFSDGGLTRIQGETLSCVFCGETFPDKWRLKFHNRSHVESSCKTLRSEEELKDSKFLKDHQNFKKRPHCECSSSDSSNLKNHITAVHTREKPHKCSHCEFEASRSFTLKRHMTEVHRGQKPHKCPHCEYKAARSDTLKIHVAAVHRGQKPHKCPHCEYRAAHSSNLKQHVTKLHVAEKRQMPARAIFRVAESTNLKRGVISKHSG